MRERSILIDSVGWISISAAVLKSDQVWEEKRDVRLVTIWNLQKFKINDLTFSIQINTVKLQSRFERKEILISRNYHLRVLELAAPEKKGRDMSVLQLQGNLLESDSVQTSNAKILLLSALSGQSHHSFAAVMSGWHWRKSVIATESWLCRHLQRKSSISACRVEEYLDIELPTCKIRTVDWPRRVSAADGYSGVGRPSAQMIVVG